MVIMKIRLRIVLSLYIDKFCITCFILLKLYNFGSEDIKADSVQTMC